MPPPKRSPITRGMAEDDVQFVPTTVLKRDAFSETFSGHDAARPGRKLVLRQLSGLPLWSRWFAWVLARREIRALRAVQGIDGVPELVRVDRDGILRGWSKGTPLNIARPADLAWYADARRLLRALRARKITHNDLAKPQNWLMRPDGGAAVIDFQLTRVHRRRNWLYRVMAYEDMRHLQKQRWRYARQTMGPKARRLLRQRSGPGKLWRDTGKRAYMMLTRRVFNWSDGEGTASEALRRAPEIRATLLADPRIRDVVLSPVPRPGRSVGLYAFVEGEVTRSDVATLTSDAALAYVQPVAALPREDGTVRADILELIAMNRLDELEIILSRDAALRDVAAPIRDGRLNFSDRVLRGRETHESVSH